SIHRFDDLEHFTVFPLQLMEKLPEIAIPLLPGDAPVIIDLQAVFIAVESVTPRLRPRPHCVPSRQNGSKRCYAKRDCLIFLSPPKTITESTERSARGFIGQGRRAMVWTGAAVRPVPGSLA